MWCIEEQKNLQFWAYFSHDSDAADVHISLQSKTKITSGSFETNDDEKKKTNDERIKIINMWH